MLLPSPLLGGTDVSLLRCHLLSVAAVGGQWSVAACEKAGEMCMHGQQMLSEHPFLSRAEGKFVTQTYWLEYAGL